MVIGPAGEHSSHHATVAQTTGILCINVNGKGIVGLSRNHVTDIEYLEID